MLGDQDHDGHDPGGPQLGSADGDTAGTRPAGLVGRASALAGLDRAVREATAGHGGLVFVTGEAGIGKTALARQMVQHALQRGVLVLWGSCREGPGVPGFWPWVEVLRAYAERVGRRRLSRQLSDAASGLAGLVPELGPGPAVTGTALAGPGVGAERAAGGTGPPPDQAGAGAADRFRMFDAVATLLRRATVARPLLMVLDDLQWADAGTLRLLRFLVPDLPRSRLLVVGAYRDEEAEAPGHPLRGLLAELAARATLLPLAGLSAPEVAALMVQTSGAPPDPELAAAVHRRTGGNPFFVQQVTQLTSLAPGAPGPVPAGVREAIERRLARLPQVCAELLAVASVAGAELRPELLAQVTGRSPAEVAWLLEVAVTARILTRSPSTGPAAPGRFAFTHDLFRECLYQGLEGSARTRLHARLAAALKALGLPGRAGLAGELARHCALAVPMVEPAAALDVTRRAATEATGRLAHEEAAGHYAQAVRLASLAGNPAARRGLLLELAEAHLRAGEFGEARARFLDAATEARATGDVPMLASAALGVHRVGSRSLTTHADSIGLLQEAWAALDSGDGHPTRAGMRARVLACLARDLVHGIGQDHARAVELSEQAVALARMLDDPATLALCLFAHHDALWVAGSATRRLPVVAEMATAAAAAGDPVLGLEARLARFVALLELGDPAAFVAFNEAARAAEELRQPHYQWMVGSRRAALALLAGRLGEAKRLIGEAVALAERIGEPDGRNVAFAQRQELARLRGGAYGVLAALRAAISTSGGEWDEAVRQSVQTWIAVLEALIGLPDSGRAHDLAAVVRSRLEPSVARVIGWQQLEQRSGLAEVAAEAAAVYAAAVADIAERTYQALLPSAASMVVVGGAVVCKDPVALHLGILAAAWRAGTRRSTTSGTRSAGRSAWAPARRWSAAAASSAGCCWPATSQATGRTPSSCCARPPTPPASSACGRWPSGPLRRWQRWLRPASRPHQGRTCSAVKKRCGRWATPARWYGCPTPRACTTLPGC